MSGRLRRCLPALLFALAGSATAARYVPLPAARFASTIPADGKDAPANIRPFLLRTEPVTNAEFLAFVEAHPDWRRDRVASLFADTHYLAHWAGPAALGTAAGPRQPVTQVSWFAAEAYCESEGARLPTWYEWEYAAAADARRRDARGDPAWRQAQLSGNARPAGAPLPDVGGAPNAYGVRDIAGPVWEWVDDFNALLVAGDSRDQNDPDVLQFCGAGALALRQKENYAVLMRIAVLSALKASDTTRNLGFRCAKP